MAPVRLLLLASSALFALGVFGMLTRRHAIAMLLAIELILNAASLNFVIFSRLLGDPQAQAVVLFIIALAACEAVVGLAIVLGLYRSARTVFADQANALKG
jgi:NADH-quinone oxidoreductase subunit K